VKFRFKVIRHLMSDSVSEMPILGSFWLIFLWEDRSTNFLGSIIKLHSDRVLCKTMTGIRSVTSEIIFSIKRIKYSGKT